MAGLVVERFRFFVALAPGPGFVTLRQRFVRRCHGRKKPQPLTGRGKSAERIEVEFGPFRPAASRRAECLLVALPTSGDLFICAKDLFVGAKHGWLRHREPVFGGRAAARGPRRALARPSTQTKAAARRGPPGKKTVPVSFGNGSDYIVLDNVSCQKSASS